MNRAVSSRQPFERASHPPAAATFLRLVDAGVSADPRVEVLTRAAIRQDRTRVRGILLEAGRSASWWEVCTRLVAPAARLAGDWWSEDRCSFMDVTLGVGLMQRLARAQADPPSPSGRGRVLLTAAPNADHTIGLLLAAERLGHGGWDVELGAPFSDRTARPGNHDVVGLSVSGIRDFDWALRTAGPLGGADTSLVIGGAGAEELARETGLVSRGPGHEAVLTQLSPA